MRKIILFVMLSYVFRSELQAQEFTQEYLLSAKQFFIDWAATQPDVISPVFLDTGYSWISNYPIEKMNANLKRSGQKIYHLAVSQDSGTPYIDSIILTTNEIQSAIQKLKQSISFNWTTEFLPIAIITNKENFSSAYHAHVDSVMKIRPRDFPGVCRWLFSLPAFLRNDTYCVFLYKYYDGGGSWRLGVYKREQDHWHFFGGISGEEW